MLNQFVEAYSTVRAAHAAVFGRLTRVPGTLKNISGNAKELADAVYALKESEKLVNDMVKDLRNYREAAEKLCCLVWSHSMTGGPVRTDHCTATPRLKVTHAHPKSGTPEYEAFCEYCGVDPKAPFRPHWPSIVDQVSESMAQGKPAPPGLDLSKTYTEFSVTTRGKAQIIVDPRAVDNSVESMRSIVERDLVLAETEPGALRAAGFEALAQACESARAALTFVAEEDPEEEPAW